MLSRDQRNVEEYLSSGSLLYHAFSAPEERLVSDALFAVDSAVASFGRAEMIDRQTSRYGALGSPATEDAGEAFRRYHDAGLNNLASAAEILREFRALVEAQGPADVDSGQLDQRLGSFSSGVRTELAALEMKPADVERLAAQLQEVISVARDGDALRLLDHIIGKVEELAKVRAGDDRGMVDNIPWWKVVAVAVFFAIAVWALIKCGWRWFGWSCSPNEALIYVLIAKAAGLGYKLC